MFPNRPRTKSPAMRRAALATTVTGLAFAGLSAALPVPMAAAATTCPSTTLVQPFLKYADQGYYWLTPGGSFEGSTAGWGFAGGAKVASGGEPSAAGGSLGNDSLALPAGATAQSPFMCVEPSDRTFRFFARSVTPAATIVASVNYESVLGDILVPVKLLTVRSTWEPSEILHTGAAQATEILGGVVHLALRFTSIGGTARIDDVYIDPRRR